MLLEPSDSTAPQTQLDAFPRCLTPMWGSSQYNKDFEGSSSFLVPDSELNHLSLTISFSKNILRVQYSEPALNDVVLKDLSFPKYNQSMRLVRAQGIEITSWTSDRSRAVNKMRVELERDALRRTLGKVLIRPFLLIPTNCPRLDPETTRIKSQRIRYSVVSRFDWSSSISVCTRDSLAFAIRGMIWPTTQSDDSWDSYALSLIRDISPITNGRTLSFHIPAKSGRDDRCISQAALPFLSLTNTTPFPPLSTRDAPILDNMQIILTDLVEILMIYQ